MKGGGICGQCSILFISMVALLAILCNTGVWLACTIEYCEIYNNTDITTDWDFGILWYTPPVVSLVLMFVPVLFGLCLGCMCYDSAVGAALAVFSTISILSSFAYICLELLALFGKEIYQDIFNKILPTETEVGKWLWGIQLGLTCFILVITVCLIAVGYCTCAMIDDDEMDGDKRADDFPTDPNYGEVEHHRDPFNISSQVGISRSARSSVQSRPLPALIAREDYVVPKEETLLYPDMSRNRPPTYNTRQEQNVDSMQSKYARYGMQPAVGPPISTTTRGNHQETANRRQDLRYGGGVDPGPPRTPYTFDDSEPLHHSNRQERHQRYNGGSSVLDYGKARSNNTGITDMRSQLMSNGGLLPRPQVNYGYTRNNDGYRDNDFDYY